jgi:hypothetical protein
MGVTPEIGTSRSGNLLLQALIEGKKSYFCCISSKFSCPRAFNKNITIKVKFLPVQIL